MNTIHISKNQCVVVEGTQQLHITVEGCVDLKLHYKNTQNIELFIEVLPHAVLNVLHFYETALINEIQQYNIGQSSEVKIAYAHLNDIEGTQNIDIKLVGEHSKVEIASGIIASNTLDITMNVEHHAKHSYANMEHYAVVSDNAKFKLYAVGKICEKMSGSQAHQTTRVLTMAKNHHCEVTPVLIIDENDVAASHANSIGQPDDLQLYYLQSRGLTIQQALNLIANGYLEPMLLLLENTTLFEPLKLIIEQRN